MMLDIKFSNIRLLPLITYQWKKNYIDQKKGKCKYDFKYFTSLLMFS